MRGQHGLCAGKGGHEAFGGACEGRERAGVEHRCGRGGKGGLCKGRRGILRRQAWAKDDRVVARVGQQVRKGICAIDLGQHHRCEVAGIHHQRVWG